jgi:hypothetical protein
MNSPNSVTAHGKPKRQRARPFFEFFGAAPPRDVTLLHVQPVAALWGAPWRALGVRYCPGEVLIRSSDCRLRLVGQSSVRDSSHLPIIKVLAERSFKAQNSKPVSKPSSAHATGRGRG